MKVYELYESEIYSLDWDKMSEHELIKRVRQNVGLLQVIKQPSEKVQLAAVEVSSTALFYLYEAGVTPSEAVLQDAVKHFPAAIVYIPNPSEALQMLAVKGYGRGININHLLDKKINISKDIILIALKDIKFIKTFPRQYNTVVRQIFKNNDLLMKKWLRYGEIMRSFEGA